MKTCPKCGKANDVTRKYCVRCGSSLIKSAEPPEPSVPEEIPEVEEAAEGGPSGSEVTKAAYESTEEGVRHVRPSQIDPDRVRGAERHIDKTEFEKAQEILSDSESDERMLRASELQGLEAEIEEEERAETPTESAVSVEEEPPEASDEFPDEEPKQVDYDEGKEVVKQILERVKAAESRAKAESPGAPGTPTEPPLPEAAPSLSEEAVEPELAPEVAPPRPEQPAARPPPASVSVKAFEPTGDPQVRQYESDIKTLNIEKQQLESDLSGLQSRLDEEVDRYRVVAETKRARAESIERDLRLAKKEHDDAKKDHKRAEDRRKKELSSANKRIDDVGKRIGKAESKREKRLKDLEKERLKREAESG
jgi:hypothetical protein